ncbi:hypothetical protein PoB_000898900 [Plakobranchus ocellatus]|uniref:Uncharacterized protein n=1 Tax=Plakobranchus ocellatus TaxID=259542 RepID=A0AAV3YHK3_9GAST|nr:hypothetical protein PoB_000898900 [Plakobranchus ocellatus]
MSHVFIGLLYRWPTSDTTLLNTRAPVFVTHGTINLPCQQSSEPANDAHVYPGFIMRGTTNNAHVYPGVLRGTTNNAHVYPGVMRGTTMHPEHNAWRRQRQNCGPRPL